jgi:hypothetical protein
MNPKEKQFPDKKETPLETLKRANEALEKTFNVKDSEKKD